MNKRTEHKVARLITEELKKSDVIDVIKNDKEAEKAIKAIIRDVIKEMYRVLWQHNSIFTSLAN